MLGSYNSLTVKNRKHLTKINSCATIMLFFGAVVGSTPSVVLFLLAITSTALINMMGEWVKGENMNTKMTSTNKFYTILRKFAGNSLIMTAAWGISATAGDAGLQL
jgi:hypothetical protein